MRIHKVMVAALDRGMAAVRARSGHGKSFNSPILNRLAQTIEARKMLLKQPERHKPLDLPLDGLIPDEMVQALARQQITGFVRCIAVNEERIFQALPASSLHRDVLIAMTRRRNIRRSKH